MLMGHGGVPSRIAMPPEIAAVYVDFDWDTRRLWALELPVQLIERARLDWHLDLPFFSSRPPEPLFDVVPRRVMEDPAVSPVHARRIEEADLGYPLCVIEHRGRVCVLDGIHRVAKACGVGRELVGVTWASRGVVGG